MKKVKGFLMAESVIALFIATTAVICLYLTVSESQKNGKEIELKTDRAYAYHVLKESNLDQVMVHDRIYEKAGHNYVYDRDARQTFSVKD
ncbi:MAG: hypothetical protein ACI4T3_06915 [Lactobacillus sp.]